MKFSELISLLEALETGVYLRGDEVCIVDEKNAFGPFMRLAISIHKRRLRKYILDRYDQLGPDEALYAESEIVL